MILRSMLVDEELWDEFRRISFESKLSISEHIRRAMIDYYGRLQLHHENYVKEEKATYNVNSENTPK